jgi:hypothetical protein
MGTLGFFASQQNFCKFFCKKLAVHHENPVSVKYMNLKGLSHEMDFHNVDEN